MIEDGSEDILEGGSEGILEGGSEGILVGVPEVCEEVFEKVLEFVY